MPFHVPEEVISTFPGTHPVPISYPCCLKDERVHPLSQLDILAKNNFLSKYIHEPHGNRESEIRLFLFLF
jgi:hypothetical protein